MLQTYLNRAGVSRAILAGLKEGRQAMSYGWVRDKAVEFGAEKIATVGMGKVLDPILKLCKAEGLPPLTSVVVPINKVERPETLDGPALVELVAPGETVADAQASVRAFDWSKAPQVADPAAYEQLAKDEGAQPISLRVTAELEAVIRRLVDAHRALPAPERATFLRAVGAAIDVRMGMS